MTMKMKKRKNLTLISPRSSKSFNNSSNKRGQATSLNNKDAKSITRRKTTREKKFKREQKTRR
jgi:hypothetical protein